VNDHHLKNTRTQLQFVRRRVQIYLPRPHGVYMITTRAYLQEYINTVAEIPSNCKV